MSEGIPLSAGRDGLAVRSAASRGSVMTRGAHRFRESGEIPIRQVHWRIDAVVALASLSLAAGQFFMHRIMSAYDSGVYFGAATQFVSGHLPYRDFVFVQPPGVLALLSPFAIIGKATSTSFGFELARLFSSVWAAAVAVLVSRLLRPYGRASSLLAGLAVALSPVAAYEMTAVKLEVYCLSLSLLAALWVVTAEQREAPSAARRVRAAGLVIGVAGSVKLWAIFSFIALVVCVWGMGRAQVLRFAGWAAAGFVLVAGPFFLLAPSEFIQQVFIAQLFRRQNALGPVSTLSRLTQMTGLKNTPFAPNTPELLFLCGAVILVVVTALRVGGLGSLSDRFFLGASALTVTALLSSREFYGYYGYFVVPLLVGLVVSSVSRICRSSSMKRHSHRSDSDKPRSSANGPVLVGVACLLLVGAGGFGVVNLTRGLTRPVQISLIDQYVPRGSCAIFDDAIEGVLSNRLVSTNPRCPVIVDAGGMSMVLDGKSPLKSASLEHRWQEDFSRAHFVVLAGTRRLGVPWTPALHSWFADRFHLTIDAGSFLIYQRD